MINIRKKVPLIICCDLRGWYLGKWKGLSHEAFRNNIQKGLEPENGETLKDFDDRTYKAVKIIMAQEKDPFLISAHGGTFIAIQKKLDVNKKIECINNAEIIEFYFESNVWQVKKIK